MGIFNQVWMALTTPNEWLINVLLVPLSVIEIYVTMMLFSTVLNIESTRKKRIIYVGIMTIVSFVSRNFIPIPYNTFINIVFWFLLVLVIFKTSILKAIFSEIIPLAVGAVLESVLLKLFALLFNISFDNVITIPIYRLFFTLSNYLIIYLLYILIKKSNFNIKILDSMSKSNKIVLLINAISGIITIAIQSYLISYYSSTLPIQISVLSTVTLIAYFIISIYSLIKATKLEIANRDLVETKLDNKSLKILYDNMSAFKHDFDNIVQAIQGYIITNDMKGLEKYHSELQKDCEKVNNLVTLRPDVINNPAVYSLLASKYHEANSEGVEINLDVFLDLNKLHMKIYEFTRILGILLDNAIQASKDSDEKIINLIIRKDKRRFRQLLIIENSYDHSKNIDLNKIFEKGYSTKSKKTNSGIGLWEVRQILKKNNNLNLHTDKTDKYFTQQLEIYFK